MATISSNSLGVYAFDLPEEDGFYLLDSAADLTVPLPVYKKTGSTVLNTTNPSAYGPDVVGRWTLCELIDGSAGAGPGVLLEEDGSFAEIVYYNGPSGIYHILVSYNFDMLSLVALATSSSLEAQNSVSETAARDGSGGSTQYIASGATNWSISTDGLLDIAANAGSAITVMDIARNKYYTVVKFDTGAGVSYVGQALVDSISLSGGVDDISTYSATFSGYADLYAG